MRHRAMPTSPARPLILTCGVALALFDLVALLPGNPDPTRTRSFLAAAAVQLLVVWRLLHRSRIACFLVVLGSGLCAVSFVLVGAPYEATFTVSCLLTLMQVGLLFTPPVLAYVFGGDDGVTASRTPALVGLGGERGRFRDDTIWAANLGLTWGRYEA
jgi:hypothetical protein